jgi:hypothetical protein
VTSTRPSKTSSDEPTATAPPAPEPSYPGHPQFTRGEDAALTAAGYTVVRFTWRQLRDHPRTIADRIRAILALR